MIVLSIDEACWAAMTKREHATKKFIQVLSPLVLRKVFTYFPDDMTNDLNRCLCHGTRARYILEQRSGANPNL